VHTFATGSRSIHLSGKMSRQYLSAGAIVEEVLQGKSLKAYCASKESLGKVDYALAMETMKYKETIVQLLTSCNISASSLDVREGVLMVMVFELLFGAGKIDGGGSVKRKIMEHREELVDNLDKLMSGKNHQSELLPQSVLDHAKIGAFVRINTVKISEQEGLEYIKGICAAAKMDPHIPALVALPPNSNSFGQSEWVKSGKLVIQDKASCFPSQILHDAWLTCGHRGDFIDACAAPGNKTSHLATLAMLQKDNTSRVLVYAFEKNPRRAQLLRDRMALMGTDKTVVVSNSDFLTVNITDPRYANVTAILLDPSCSGSGVVKSLERALEHNDDDDAGRSERLASLQAFQIKVIQKAMTFPRVQRIVYSTCSVHLEENEVVVAEILRHAASSLPSASRASIGTDPNPKKKAKKGATASQDAPGWRLVAPPRLKDWKRRGLPLTAKETGGATLTTEQSAALVRCAPEDGTNGFFVSLFERVGPLPPAPEYDPALDPPAAPQHRATSGSKQQQQGGSKPKTHKATSDASGQADAGGSAYHYRPPKEKVVKAASFLGKFKVQKRRKH
jgi:putative methyltransferase